MKNARYHAQEAAKAVPDTSGSFTVDMALLSDPGALSALIEVLVNRLDDLNGDPDLEEEPDLEDGGDTELNGDEGDYSQSEDDGPSWHEPWRPAAPVSVAPLLYLEMDKDGNVSFMKDGARWVGGRLDPRSIDTTTGNGNRLATRI